MKNKYLAIAIACDYEVTLIDSNFDQIKIDDQTYFINNNIILFFCGVGKVSAASSLTLLIKNFCLHGIINIGSCLGINGANALDIILGTAIQYGDVDITADSKYEINQMVSQPKYFYTSSVLNQLISQVLVDFDQPISFSKIMTVDSFVTTKNINKFNEINDQDVQAIDMEACALAQVANNFEIKFSVIKIVSDTLLNQVNNHDDFVNNIQFIAKLINKIITKFCLSNIFF